MGINLPKCWFKSKAPKPEKRSVESEEPIRLGKPKVTLKLPSTQKAEDHVLLVEDELEDHTESPIEPPPAPRPLTLELEPEPDAFSFLGREEQDAIAKLIYGESFVFHESELDTPVPPQLLPSNTEPQQCSVSVSNKPVSVFHKIAQEAVHANDPAVFGSFKPSGNEGVQSPMLADEDDVDVDVLMGAASQEMCIDDECEVSDSSVPTINWQATAPENYNNSRPPSYCEPPAYESASQQHSLPTNDATPAQAEGAAAVVPNHSLGAPNGFSGRTMPLPMYTPLSGNTLSCEALKIPEVVHSYDASRQASVDRVLSRRGPKYERDKWSTLHRITTKRRQRRHQPFPTEKQRRLKIITATPEPPPSISLCYSAFRAWERSVTPHREVSRSNAPSPDSPDRPFSPTTSIASDVTLCPPKATSPGDGVLNKIQSMIQTLQNYKAQYLASAPAIEQVKVLDLEHAEGLEDLKSTTVKIAKLNKDVGELTAEISSAIMRDKEQFQRNILSFIRNTMTDAASFQPNPNSGLKKVAPYWYRYTTMAKLRWLGRELLEVVSTEFRDRSMEYYRYALESGVTTVNGKVAGPKHIIQDGDCLENVVHRHEPPVTSTPVRVIHHDTERNFIVVDKPGSIPVHASGRYFRNTLIGILEGEFGYKKVYTCNRLDRLTSGLMILPLSVDVARELTNEFTSGRIGKEYVARCRGKFPSEETICEEPLLTVDRQMGLNIVHPEGKPAKTVFNLIRYDPNTDSSVVHCRPLTGRSHQIRVHLQFLGHPIANDPVYSETKIWGENRGKGGIDIVPSEERAAPAPPPHLQALTDESGSPETLTKTRIEGDAIKLLPRETGEDIGMGSPVPLSSEAVGVITRLRNMKDEDEDWSRWRDIVFRAKGALTPHGLEPPKPHPNQRRPRGGHIAKVKSSSGKDPTEEGSQRSEGNPSSEPTTIATTASVDSEGSFASSDTLVTLTPLTSTTDSEAVTPSAAPTPDLSSHPPPDSVPPQLTIEEALEKVSIMEPAADTTAVIDGDNLYCPECFLPLHPDPKPERLYIFLHALRYTTSLGSFETQMPEWAAEGWSWDRSD